MGPTRFSTGAAWRARDTREHGHAHSPGGRPGSRGTTPGHTRAKGQPGGPVGRAQPVATPGAPSHPGLCSTRLTGPSSGANGRFPCAPRPGAAGRGPELQGAGQPGLGHRRLLCPVPPLGKPSGSPACSFHPVGLWPRGAQHPGPRIWKVWGLLGPGRTAEGPRALGSHSARPGPGKVGEHRPAVPLPGGCGLDPQRRSWLPSGPTDGAAGDTGATS